MNRCTTFNGLGATYDLNGNLKTYNGWTYTYDAQNRLTTVKQGTTTVAQYWYDGLNRQITRNMNGAITFHVWDGWNLIEERGDGERHPEHLSVCGGPDHRERDDEAVLFPGQSREHNAPER